jgi:CBS domain-containing protein
MYEVRDAFTPNVISIDPDTTIDAALQILIENDVSGAPVIDKNGRLCGIISQFQLLEIAFDPEVRQGLVRDFMTRKVITVKENTLLATVANVLMVRRIRRLPVVRDGKVVGIISRGDLVKYFAKTGERLRSFIENLRKANDDSRPVEQESEILASLIA